MAISFQDVVEVSNLLTQHSAIGYALWSVGEVVESEEIDTACVYFNATGKPFKFAFNPEFWEGLTPYERAFVVTHECLHVILRHGNRLAGDDKDTLNIAADLVVNHMAIDMGLDRNRISMWEDLVWLDTVKWPDELEVLPNQSLEYYLSKLKQADLSGMSTLDSHDTWEPMNSPEGQPSDEEKAAHKAIESYGSFASQSERDKLSKELTRVIESGVQAGRNPLRDLVERFKPVVKRKRKWETVIRNWCTKALEDSTKDSHWLNVNRRFSLLNSELLLPGDMEVEEKDSITVYLFLDTSGSCHPFAERFFKAAHSIPRDRFKVHLFGFSTKVYEVKNNELKDFGGTYFHILEEKVAQEKTYPDAVFVLTDGWGSKITPKHPERWHWFMTPTYSPNQIPKASRIFKLHDYS